MARPPRTLSVTAPEYSEGARDWVLTLQGTAASWEGILSARYSLCGRHGAGLVWIRQ